MTAMALALGLLATLAVGCNSSGGTHAADTTAVPTSETTTPPPTTADAATRLAQDKADITATIVEFNRLFDAASASPADPPDQIFDLVGEPETTAVKKALANLVLTHQTGHEPSPSKAKTDVSDVVIRDPQATATQCSVNDFVVTDSETGRILNDHVGTYLYAIELTRAAGAPHGWVITSSKTLQRWEGIAGCATAAP